MALYVDGFVISVPKRKIDANLKIAHAAGKVWREHGALEYRECVGDDLAVKMCMPFPRGIKSKKNETVLFSYILYKSRAHRDRVNAKVMKDPRLTAMMENKDMPMDPNRMLYGGFTVAVDE